jgi:hypothetical protein
VHSLKCKIYSAQLDSAQLDSAQFTVHNLQCTICSAKFTVHSLQCTIYSAKFTVQNLQCIVYSASLQCQFTVHNLQCKIYSAQFTVHNLPYTIYITQFNYTIYSTKFTSTELYSVILLSVSKPCPDTVFCQCFANWNCPYSLFRKLDICTVRFYRRLNKNWTDKTQMIQLMAIS